MSRFRSQSWTADGELNMPRRNVQREVQVPLMIHEKKPRTGPKAIVFTQGKTFFLLLVSWIVFVLYIRLSRSRDDVVSAITGLQPHNHPKTASLHLLVSAPKFDPNLCRFMVSAAVTGYPSPVILNWGQSDDGDEGPLQTKIGGIYEYFTKLDPYQDDDLVLLVDGYDTWMQLRPQTLVDRYFEINRRANERVVNELGKAVDQHSVSHEIVFTSQKRCSTWNADDPPCYAVPQSSLPQDIYGPETDRGVKSDLYTKNRQRFLHPGIIMGTARAMRKTFAEAKILLETENFSSEEEVFSTIFGDQELWREATRKDSHQKFWSFKPKGKSPVHFNEHVAKVRAKAAAQDDQTYEFGIGLDYEGLIGFARIDAETDTEWLVWSNQTALRAAEKKLGVLHVESRMHSLTRNISDTVPPFWTFHNEKSLSRWTRWQDIPLFTNVWTGHTPAIIVHDKHIDTNEKTLQRSWRQTWFHSHARTLFDASVYEPVLPVAYSGPGDNSSLLREYWPDERWKGGGRNGAGPWDPHRPNDYFGDKWLGFEGICGGWPEEVFGDGRGKWLLPKVH